MAFLSRHKIVSSILILLLLLAAYIGYRTIGPHRFYEVDLVLSARTVGQAPGVLEVGAAHRDITPDLDRYDSWVDVNENGRWDPDVDTYVDRTGSGTFDFVWVAGFNMNRPAKRVDTPLAVRAIAFRNNGVTVAFASIDSVGIMHEHFIDIRKALAETTPDLDHAVFTSTHTHNAPDTMGIWSYSILRPRFDHAYLAHVKAMTQEAIEEAVRALEPAEAIFAEAAIEPEGFVRDTRLPTVYDLTVCSARFVRPGTEETIATLVSWGCHPESYGGADGIISADFPHYWREALERGLPNPNGEEGFGGIAVFLQGQVGGLMTQLRLAVPDRNGVEVYEEEGLDKARAQGENLALVSMAALRGPGAVRMDRPEVAVVAETVYAPISGTFAIPIFLGLVHPGWYWGKAKSEVNAIRIGDIEILTLPGESYPEICEGGVESPGGADFPGLPVETPPLRAALMRGKMNVVVNLANDQIGYIIPRTQWDTKPPYAYGRDKPQYGEVNSGGPGVAPALHGASMDVLGRLHTSIGGVK